MNKRCSFITHSSCCTLSGIENGRSSVGCYISVPWIGTAPCSPRRPNPTIHSFAQGAMCSSMCSFGDIEQSWNAALNCVMNCEIAGSVYK